MEQEINKITQDNQDGDKIEKQFSAILKKLTAIIGGQEQLKPMKRIPNDEMSILVNDLFKEERQSLISETKSKLKELLKQYHEMLKAFRQKDEELEKLRKEKKKEFVKAANVLFEKIENVGDIEKSYYDGLVEITKQTE